MSFDKKCMRLGVITMLCALVANFLPVAYLYITTGVVPSGGEIGQIIAMVAASFLIGWILQPITFYPALGVGGSFLAWTTGNVSDLRMPAVAAAQKSADVEGGTEAGNVISTMAVAVSNLLIPLLVPLPKRTLSTLRVFPATSVRCTSTKSMPRSPSMAPVSPTVPSPTSSAPVWCAKPVSLMAATLVFWAAR